MRRAAAIALLGPLMGAYAEEFSFGRTAGSGALKLDLYRPTGHPGELRPAAIVIHGGGWMAGSRSDADTVTLARWLAGAGYVTAAIDYQPEFPAALEDVRTALRFVRAQSRKWMVDPKRVALIGLEAGAHLANIAGVWPGSAEARAAAVVSFHGPSDFRGWPASDELQKFLAPLIASRGLAGALEHASPVMHIDPRTAPPFLLVHGDADVVVPPVQSIHWQNALQAAGVPCNLLLIGGGGHGFESWRGTDRDWESEVLAWLASALGRR